MIFNINKYGFILSELLGSDNLYRRYTLSKSNWVYETYAISRSKINRLQKANLKLLKMLPYRPNFSLCLRPIDGLSYITNEIYENDQTDPLGYIEECVGVTTSSNTALIFELDPKEYIVVINSEN